MPRRNSGPPHSIRRAGTSAEVSGPGSIEKLSRTSTGRPSPASISVSEPTWAAFRRTGCWPPFLQHGSGRCAPGSPAATTRPLMCPNLPSSRVNGFFRRRIEAGLAGHGGPEQIRPYRANASTHGLPPPGNWRHALDRDRGRRSRCTCGADEARTPHEVPLTPLALAQLPERGDDGCVFSKGSVGFKGWSGAKKALDRRIADLAAPMPAWGLHDFRRTFSTMAHERGFANPT